MSGPSGAEGGKRRQPLILRILRISGKSLAWVLGILLGLLLLAWLVLLIFFPDDKLRRMLVDELSQQLGVPVRAGKLELHVLSGLVLTDVSVGPPPGFQSDPIAIDRLVVDYSLGQIFEKKFIVRRVLLEHPVITLEMRQGKNNLGALAALRRPGAEVAEVAGEKKEGFTLDLESMRVEDLGVVLKSEGIEASLQGGTLTLSGKLGAKRMHLDAALSLPCPEQPSLSVALPPGMLPGGNKLSASVGLKLQASLEGSGEASASGSLEICRLEGEGGSHRLTAEFSARADPSAGRAVLESLQIDLDGQALLLGSGELAGRDDRTAYSLLLDHLVIASPQLGNLAAGALGPLSFGGEARLEDVHLEGLVGEGTWPKASARLVVDRASLSGPALQLSPLSGEANLILEPVEQGGRIQIQGAFALGALRSGKTQAEGTQFDFKGSALARPALEEPDAWLVEGAPWSFGLRADSIRTGPVGSASSTLPVMVDARKLALEGRLDPSAQPARFGSSGKLLPATRLSLTGKAGAVGGLGLRLEGAVFTLDARFPGMNLDQGVSAVEVTAATAKIQGARASLGGAVLDSPAIELEGKGGGLLPGGRFRKPFDLRARLRLKGMGAGRLLIGAAEVGLATNLARLGSGTLPLNLNFSAEGVVLDRGNGAKPFSVPGTLALDLAGKLDTGSGELVMENLNLKLAELASLQVQGVFDWSDRRVDCHLHSSPMRIEKLLAQLPPENRVGIPVVSGEIELEGKIQGGLPAGDLSLDQLPFSAEGTVMLRGVESVLASPPLQWRDLSGQVRLSLGGPERSQRLMARLTADGLSLGTGSVQAGGVALAVEGSRESGDLNLSGRISAARLEASGLFPQGLSNVTVNLDSRLVGMKELWLRKLDLALPTLGLAATAGGQVVWPGGTPRLSELRASGNLLVSFRSESPVVLPGGIAANGQAELAVRVESQGAGEFDSEGKISFNGFNLEAGSLSLSGVRGGIPVVQRVATVPAFGLLPGRAAQGAEGRSDRERRSSAYDDALRPMKGEGRSFSIEKVRFQDLSFTEVTGSLELADGRLSLASLRFGFLRGDVLASMSLLFAPPGTRRLMLSGEMSGIDLSGLGALSLAGTSDVAGNLNLQVDLASKDVTAAVDLTEIGESTLQALLVAVDPKEINPGVIHLRQFLDRYQVSPQRVSLNLRHGLFGLEAAFTMGLAARTVAGMTEGFEGTTFRLKPQPIGGFLAKYLSF